MNIQKVKAKLKKSYPHIEITEEKEGDITFLFTNLEDEELHDLDYNHLCNQLESRCEVPLSIEFREPKRF